MVDGLIELSDELLVSWDLCEMNIWNLKSRSLHKRFEGNFDAEPPRLVKLSNSMLAIAPLDGYEIIRIFNPLNGKTLREISPNDDVHEDDEYDNDDDDEWIHIECLLALPNEQLAVACDGVKSEYDHFVGVLIYSEKGGQLLRTIRVGYGLASALVLLNDQKSFAVACENLGSYSSSNSSDEADDDDDDDDDEDDGRLSRHSLAIFNLASGKMEKCLTKDEKRRFTHLTVLNDGSLVSWSKDKALKAWDVKTGACLKTVMTARKTIKSLVASKTSSFFASHYEDDTKITVWTGYRYYFK
jgi:WD40 repeat protein